jgi:hypothetical protein
MFHIHVRVDIWRCRVTRIHVSLHAPDRKTTNSHGNQVCHVFCRTQWVRILFVRYEDSGVHVAPNITQSSDDHRRDTSSVDHFSPGTWLIGKLTVFFSTSGVQLPETDLDQSHFRRATFTQQLKNRVDLTLAKVADLRITFNLDGAPIISKSHTHPSHSETSRLLTSSLSLGIPVPRSTQCMWGM